MKRTLTNKKGFMLVSSVLLTTILIGSSIAIMQRSLSEARVVEREVDRVRAYCAAEAGLQCALGQIGTNGYTGFVNTAPVAQSLSIANQQVATCQATITPDTEDYVIVNATGNGLYTSRTFEARVFLDSNLSKYLVYADTSSFGSGSNATYGNPLVDEVTGNIIYDTNGRERVAQDPNERAMMYFTGDWVVSGSNVTMFGDVYSQDDIIVNSGADGDVHGDTYAYDQYYVNGVLITDDTWNDGSDQKAMENDMFDSLMNIDLGFYAAHNNTPQFAGGSPTSRFLEFAESADGTHTVVREYNDRQYTAMVNQYDLPSTAVVYVYGDAYVKGTIKGRVSVVSSDDIFLQDDIVYANGKLHADESDAAAFLARDLLYFCGSNMESCGIYYAENVSGASAAFDARYDTNGYYNPGAKNSLNVRGNRIIKGSTNLSYYGDRAYIWDPYLKKYRPPGLPITSVVSFIREIDRTG